VNPKIEYLNFEFEHQYVRDYEFHENDRLLIKVVPQYFSDGEGHILILPFFNILLGIIGIYHEIENKNNVKRFGPNVLKFEIIESSSYSIYHFLN